MGRNQKGRLVCCTSLRPSLEEESGSASAAASANKHNQPFQNLASQFPNCIDQAIFKGNQGIQPHRWEQHVCCRGGVLLGCSLVGHVEVVHGRCRSGGASGRRGGRLGAVDVPRDCAAVQHLHLPELGFPDRIGNVTIKSSTSSRR